MAVYGNVFNLQLYVVRNQRAVRVLLPSGKKAKYYPKFRVNCALIEIQHSQSYHNGLRPD